MPKMNQEQNREHKMLQDEAQRLVAAALAKLREGNRLNEQAHDLAEQAKSTYDEAVQMKTRADLIFREIDEVFGHFDE